MGATRVDLSGEPGDFLKRISVATPVPSHIGWSDVEHIRSTTRAVATAENVFGGGLSCEAAIAQLRWAGKLLDVEFAQVRSDRLMYTARAMLSTLRARLLALTRRHDETRSEVARADAFFSDGKAEENPPWLTYYDKAEHQGSIGKALMPVARAERNFDIAAPRLREAIALHRKTYPRSRAFSRTRLATLAMETGDPHEAVNLGRELLDEVSTLRSDRISRELHDLTYEARLVNYRRDDPARDVLDAAASHAGVDGTGATLIRDGSNTRYQLAQGVVARIGPPGTVDVPRVRSPFPGG